MRESSTTDLVGALQPRRTRVAWVESDRRREGEARAERDNSAYVPSAKNRIGQATPVHECLAFSHRHQVIDAVHPALAIIVVRQPFFRRDIVTVLGPRSVAADFGLVIDGFAEGERTQEVKAMASPLFSLDLKCVISGVSAIRDRRESPILALEGGGRVAVGRQGRVVRRLGRGNLVVVAQDLQVSAFRSDIAGTDYNLARQLVFEIQIPLVIHWRMRIPVLAGHIREWCLARIEGRESRRQGNLRRRYAVAVECRLEEEREIVVDLQRVARANFVEDKKAPIPSPNHEWLRRKTTEGQAKARQQVKFVQQEQGCLSCNPNCSGDAAIRKQVSHSPSAARGPASASTLLCKYPERTPRRCAGDCRNIPRSK